MITENLSTLKIHKLTQAQYDRELENGTLDETALYLTPDETVDMSQYLTASSLICHSETIAGSLSTGTTNVTHTITKTWSNGIPVVRLLGSTPVIYTVMDDNDAGELYIRTQRPTGVAATAATEYTLQVDVIGV